MWQSVCYFLKKIDFRFSGRLVRPAHGKSLRICNGRRPENENLIKLVFMVGLIWKLIQKFVPWTQTCVLSFAAVGSLFFEKNLFFVFWSFGMVSLWVLLRICSGRQPEKWKSNKIGSSGRINQKIDKQFGTIDANMFVKFLWRSVCYFSQKIDFSFSVSLGMISL